MSVSAPKRSRTGILLSLIAVLALAVIALVDIPQQGEPYSPTSTASTGTRALAQILKNHGVDVSEVSPLEAMDSADTDTTLVIDPSFYAPTEVTEDLVNSRATIVVLGDSSSMYDFGFEGYTESFPPIPVAAKCQDPDAQEARGISPLSLAFRPDRERDVTGCFPQLGGYGWVQLTSNPKISLILDPTFLTNEYLADHGNAAFAMRKLGTQPKVLWVSGDYWESEMRTTPQWAGLPTWFYPLLVGLVLTALWWAFYRGRRFGKLVAEPMPVVVPASEADAGRGQLYHRGRATEHAARALRAGTISRVARGRLSPASPREVVVDVLARVSGRDPSAIDALFYSFPITSDADLSRLADQLDEFEREINDR
ncbi:DUF4350 domain-containing protein [Trueperella bernardiae]|uniref:DUF4350 domain-containing protein n=1 Tax=Trueperella bernardiae TaxID=59561 RepID=A0AAW6ZIE6_9ACTO|nr:DUF4350 domain-containing protein [Trueperella bernardiae]MCM3907124.1 DUF4350 domain-containing protein [Trueperella bernardiae]MDK8601497.1 DUF4350 domain-containing protein [Trueperella bernardiae]